MRILILLLCILSPALVSAQAVNDKVLLIEHNNFRKQYFFAEGNRINFLTRQGERARGILVELTDSTAKVDNKVYQLGDIAKIRRQTKNNFVKVIGGIFILDGVLFIAAAAVDPDYAGS